MDIFHLLSFKLRIMQQLREAYNNYNLSNFVIEKEEEHKY
jgi:queuine/archaeosine tRNA-ribosyltransferase